MIHAVIDRMWNGVPARARETVRLDARRRGQGLRVEIHAPFHGDPPPPAPPGRLDGLWDHEVVELFLVGAGGEYLELEVGPHGHWLALTLSAPRVVERDDHALAVAVERVGDRWDAVVEVPAGLLPSRLARWNAFAIHGVGAERRYLAAAPLGGERPDFHRVHEFPRVAGAG